VAIAVIDKGAHSGKRALRISGTVRPGPSTWAGARFFPGTSTREPANLSGKRTLSFWAKGDGKTYGILMFADGGAMSPTVTFTAEKAWKKFEFPLAQFEVDMGELTDIFIGAVSPATFDLTLDDVRFE
jgi:hypothetical protein